MIETNNQVNLKDINKIIIQDNSVSNNDNEIEESSKKFSLPKDFLCNLVCNLIGSAPNFSEILDKNIVSAQLLIKFSKPRKMKKEDYERIMGAYMKPISETDDICFDTKKNGKIKGSEILKTKTVSIELTETKKINEPHLHQEMESFLKSLRDEELNN